MTVSWRVVTENNISHAISKTNSWGCKSWSNKCCSGCEGRTKYSDRHHEQPSLDSFKHPDFLLSEFMWLTWTKVIDLTAFPYKEKRYTEQMGIYICTYKMSMSSQSLKIQAKYSSLKYDLNQTPPFLHLFNTFHSSNS